VKTICQEFIIVFKNLYSFFPFCFFGKTRARSRTRRLLTILFPASPAQNNSHWSLAQDAGYPWSLLTVLPRPPPCLHRDFSIVFSPPHTGVRAYYVSRVVRIRTTCIPSAPCTYTGTKYRAMRVSHRRSHVFPGFHVGSVTTDWISCHWRRINRRSTRNNDFSSLLFSSPRLLYTRK